MTGYVPVVSENSGSQVVDVSIFLVNDPAVGFLALHARDPHQGCRVSLASELPPDTGWELSAEVVFLNVAVDLREDKLDLSANLTFLLLGHLPSR